MKLNTATDFVESGNITQTGMFSIKQSPLAFQILSSGLYSDKVAAVLRELGCNAADAHNEQGTPDLPIEVKLPTAHDRTFYVKDWGPGLTHKQVCDPEEGLYTTYFASTKTHSNRDTGAFGLGSKSPFAYTDQFTIETARDGEHRVYAAYRNAEGFLACDLLETRPASDDWPHGLKVSMPVARTDFSEFATKAQKIYAFFRVTPKVIGSQLSARATEDVFFNLKKATEGTNGSNYYSRDPVVVMGNVSYPISIGALQDKGASSLDMAILNITNYNDLLFDVPIGTVSVTPSRESIEYTADTIKNLKTAIYAEFATALKTLVTLVDATDGKLDALTALRAGNWFVGSSPVANFMQGNHIQLAKHVGLTLTEEQLARLAIVLSQDFPMSALLPAGFESNLGLHLRLDTRGQRPIVRQSSMSHHYRHRDISKLRVMWVDCKNPMNVARYNIRERRWADEMLLVSKPEVLDALKLSPRCPTIYALSSLLKPPKIKRVKSANGTKAQRGIERRLPLYDLHADYTDYNDTGEEWCHKNGYEPPPVPLTDVPENQRCCIIRVSRGWGQRGWYATNAGGPSIQQARWGHTSPEQYFNSLTMIGTLCPDLALPTKIFVLTEGVASKLLAKFPMPSLAQRIDAVGQAIRDEIQTLLAKRTAKVAALPPQSTGALQLVLGDNNYPCRSSEGDCVFQMVKRLYSDTDLSTKFWALISPTSDFRTFYDSLKLSDTTAAAASVTLMPDEARYKALERAHELLGRPFDNWPDLGGPPTNTNMNRSAATVLFDDISRTTPRFVFASRILNQAEEVKVGNERVARLLAACLD